jgi:hypothetical protein
MRHIQVFISILIFAGIPTLISAQPVNFTQEFKQILPRGEIAAITNPTYLPADQAQIDKNAWVLGVIINGQKRAYSLNLLNYHEVVNDKIGELAFATVW